MNKKLLLILILAAVLRLWSLDKYPAGLNADEAAIGYNAYSLLQTGRDEHGAVWPLVFRSFDDYKPPLYFYLVMPFVKVLGLSIWAVRLPSVLLGIASVYLIYLLATRLLRSSVGLLVALLLAISPWHLHFSRGAWEANTASFLLLLGVYAFLKALEKPPFLYLSALAFVLSLYTYHSARIVAPLLVLFLFFIYRPKLSRDFFLAGLLGLLLIIPLGLQLVSREGQSRFAGVSVFADQGPLWDALELRAAHPPKDLFAKVIHNRYLSYTFRFGKNYLSHFSPRFLFVTGDEIARSKVPEMGQFLLYLSPFFYLGLFLLVKENRRQNWLVLGWLFLAPTAAALTFQSPHALRSQNMVIPATIVIAFGLTASLDFFSRLRRPLALGTVLFIFFLITYSFAKYLHQYYVHYPKELPYAWQYGFREIAAYIREKGDKYDRIVVSDRYDQPYILLAFFLKTDPAVLQQATLTPRDQFGFSTVRNFSKFEFRRIDYGQDQKLKDTLLVAADEFIPGEKIIHEIKSPLGETLFKFAASP